MTSTTTAAKLPAFRITAGMTIRHDRRVCRVVRSTPVMFVAAGRRSLPLDERSGVRLLVKPVSGGRSLEITARNFELITIAG